MRRLVWIAVGAAALAAGGYYVYDVFVKAEPAPTVQQRTAQVVRGELSVSVSGSGTVSTVHKEEVRAGADGELEQVLVQAGDIVSAGQLLAVFEAPDVDTQIKQKENAIKKQELQFEQLKGKYITAADDSARVQAANDIESLKLDMESSRLELEDLREQQADAVRIVSPIAGKVTVLDVSAGEQVQPDTLIATIVDYDNLQSVIQVDELDIPKIKVGLEAKITLDALADTELAGEVTHIADEGTATNGISVFDVTVAYKAVDNVKSGMTAQVEIMIERKEDALLLPIEAVRDVGGRKMVILAQNEAQAAKIEQTEQTEQGRMPGGDMQDRQQGMSPRGEGAQALGQGPGRMNGSMREVTVGIYNETYIEIVSGLAEGEVVVMPAIAIAAPVNESVPAGFGGGFPGAGMGGMPSGGTARQFGGGQPAGGARP